MSDNKLYIAAAGAGKTTFLVHHACDLAKDDNQKSIAIITYTRKNQQEIKNRFIAEQGFVPSNIKICGWFDFLLTYCIRPFMGAVIDDLRCKTVGLMLVNENSGTIKKNGRYFKTYKVGEIKKKYLADSNHIYSDKLSEFAYECYTKRTDLFWGRLENIFSSILIDEVQDLSAWDYSIISVLLKIKKLHVVMCGDLRQKTYSTNPGVKWKKYKGRIDEYLKNEVNKKRQSLIDIDYTTLNCSHRFGKEIADFASLVIGDDFPKTMPCQCENCIKRQDEFHGKKGMFLIKRSDVPTYISQYEPLVLVWDKKHKETVASVICNYEKHKETVGPVICNYGDAKGASADSCLIFPTNRIISKFLSSNQNQLPDNTRCKLYVAVTRARYVSAIVVDDNFDNNKIGLPFWNSNN